ncbi:MAG: hypothetical protein ABJD51_14220, partial [Roseobacter sp.]
LHVYQPIHSALSSFSSRILSRIMMSERHSFSKTRLSVSKAVTGYIPGNTKEYDLDAHRPHQIFQLYLLVNRISVRPKNTSVACFNKTMLADPTVGKEYP